MYLGRIVGRVWSTVKDPSLESQRLLLVQPVDAEGAAAGRPLICTDAAGAGAGELVYFCGGREASFPFRPAEVPTDRTIVAIVDEVRIEPQIQGA